MKRNPLPLYITGFCVMAVALLTGCFDTNDEFTINPDGSGKVVHECRFQVVNLTEDSDDTSEDALKKAASEVIENAKGVDVWRDVTFKRLDDGRIFFKGTAYFKNLSQLDIPNQEMLEFDWNKLGDGTMLLTLRTNKGGADNAAAKTDDWSDLSPEERAKKLKAERGKFQQMKPMMTAVLGTMKHVVVLHLPGKVTESSNFSKAPSGALQLQFSGAKLMEAMESLVNDDAWISENADSLGGSETPAFDDEINAILFGSKAPVRATIAAATPLFNYANEVGQARKDFAGMSKQLGLRNSVVTIAAAAKGGQLKSLKVAGVRLVTETGKKNGSFRPFNWEPGYTVVLLAQFPGSILGLTEQSTFVTAIADDGSSLLPDSEWQRRIHSPQISDDKSSALFELEMKLPGPNVTGLKEISGRLHYSVASSSKSIDLGFDELTPKSKGTELGAEIESIEDGWKKDGSQRIRLALKTRKESIRSVSIVFDGVKTDLEENGYGGGGNSWSITYESKAAIPVKGRLVAEVYDRIQTFEVPFKLENISLLGRPLNPGKPN